MSRKEKILRMVASLPDDVSYDRVMYHLTVMKKIEIGIEQDERGYVHDHEDVFRELLGNEEDNARLVRSGKGGSRGHKTTHRARRTARSA